MSPVRASRRARPRRSHAHAGAGGEPDEQPSAAGEARAERDEGPDAHDEREPDRAEGGDADGGDCEGRAQSGDRPMAPSAPPTATHSADVPEHRDGELGPAHLGAGPDAACLPAGVTPRGGLSHLLGGVRRVRYGRSARTRARVPTIDDQHELRRRVGAAPVARLATVRPDGSPRLVPISSRCSASCCASPSTRSKRGAKARHNNIEGHASDPRVTLLVDHYDADWSALWWVRIEGTAAVHADGTPRERALDELAAKYPPYRAARPAGPVVIVTPRRWSGWSAR